jgi:hypothetical protein
MNEFFLFAKAKGNIFLFLQLKLEAIHGGN